MFTRLSGSPAFTSWTYDPPAIKSFPYSASFLTSKRVTKASPGGCKDPVPVKQDRRLAFQFGAVKLGSHRAVGQLGRADL